MQGSDWRKFGLVAVCGLALCLPACSDTKEQAATPSPAKGVSEQKSAKPAAGQTPGAATTTPAPDTAAGGGGGCATMLTAKCIECHAVTRICEKLGKKSKSRWQRTIDRMIGRGAKVNAAEAATLLDCLDKGATNDLQNACR